jgi:hypothetical protein
MSEPGTPAPGADVDRCPACGARVVPSQDWCGLCLQPLRAAPAEEPLEEVDAGWASVPPGGLDERVWTGPPGEDLLDPARDGDTDGDGPGRTAPAGLPPGVAEAMLAELSATTAAERPLARGPLAGMSRGGRLLLGCGAGIVLVGIVVGLLALVGLLLW